MTEALAATGVFEAVVEYAELFASFASEFLDLRGHVDHPALHPDKSIGYPQGNALADAARARGLRSEEHTSELQSLMRTSYAVFCLTKKNMIPHTKHNHKQS